jgi:type IV pilus assembly protein PilX
MKHTQQRGFVLITALIFLLVLSLLGVTALRSTLFEERLANNDADLAFARENAELALRDAERDIMGRRVDGQYCAVVACTNRRPAGTRPTSNDDASTFFRTGTVEIIDSALDEVSLPTTTDPKELGVYKATFAAACGLPLWSAANWQDGASPPRTCTGTYTAALPTTPYGFFTDAPAPAAQGTVALPRYLIELVSPGEIGINPKQDKLMFRVTAVGFGRTSGADGARTSVTLQSVFAP